MRPLTPITKSAAELASFLGIDSNKNFIIHGLTTATSLIEQGDLFIALPGTKSHGSKYVLEARNRGAVAVLTDQAGFQEASSLLPTFVVDNPRFILGDLAAWFYGRPFSSLRAVGITGTNGKTTTASLVNQIWGFNNRESGFIGTIGISLGKEPFPSQLTTPESTELQSTVATMVERGARDLVMEVSSHAIAQRRIAGARFSEVAFKNLTQDHLDFHGDMQNYFETKAKLFTPEYADEGFINIDSSYGQELFSQAQIPVHSVSRENKKATWHYTRHDSVHGGYEIAIRGEGGILIEGFLPLVGGHNLDNALMSIALAVHSGVDPLTIENDMRKLAGPAGRLEKIDLGQKFLALVDYAHTPDAVTRVLEAVKEITPGRVIALLGCGGDRDPLKRPLMGKALVDGCDFAILTSDNPRSESASAILDAMSSEISLSDYIIREEDRRGAIAIAVSEAQPGDSVIALGKGHEAGQEIMGIKYPFDDRIELARAIEQLS
jgi:UDP-N-acetylmuramoyl-L-alanyl-D-glutamate--2,6-diaminopimelate ligase